MFTGKKFSVVCKLALRASFHLNKGLVYYAPFFIVVCNYVRIIQCFTLNLKNIRYFFVEAVKKFLKNQFSIVFTHLGNMSHIINTKLQKIVKKKKRKKLLVAKLLVVKTSSRKQNTSVLKT